MPLKVVQRDGSNVLYIRGTVRGQSVFESTGTADPERAEGFRVRREKELWDRSVYGARAVVTFPAAVESYLGAKKRSDQTKIFVTKLLVHFKERKLSQIDQEAVDKAYKVILTRDAGPAAQLRTVLTPLRAILRHAARRKWCDLPVFETPVVQTATAPFLLPKQAAALIEGASSHLRPLLIFQIGTGCRMSESLELDWSRVDLEGGRAIVWQKQQNEREVDLPPVVLTALEALPYRSGAVFRRPMPEKAPLPEGWLGYATTGRMSGGQIGTAWATACRRAELPGRWREWMPRGSNEMARAWVPELTPHDMRHTWATWHYCIHRDLLKLRDDGGWASLKMVTRYAKRMPDAHRRAAMAWLAGSAKSVQVASSEQEFLVPADT